MVLVGWPAYYIWRTQGGSVRVVLVALEASEALEAEEAALLEVAAHRVDGNKSNRKQISIDIYRFIKLAFLAKIFKLVFSVIILPPLYPLLAKEGIEGWLIWLWLRHAVFICVQLSN